MPYYSFDALLLEWYFDGGLAPEIDLSSQTLEIGTIGNWDFSIDPEQSTRVLGSDLSLAGAATLSGWLTEVAITDGGTTVDIGDAGTRLSISENTWIWGDNDQFEAHFLVVSYGLAADPDTYNYAIIQLGGDALSENMSAADANDLWGQVSGLNVDLDPVDPADFPDAYDLDALADSYAPDTNLIIGTDGGDLLQGTAGDDVIWALDGPDRLEGGAGNDTLLGDSGSDSILAGDGDDVVLGGDRGDVIAASNGDDTVFGEGGNDQIGGGEGNDSIEAGDGNDIVGGGGGDDIILLGSGDNVASGGAGNDLIIDEAGDSTIGGVTGDDTINGGSGDDSLGGGAGQDLIFAGNGNDAVGGGYGADTIYGEGGDDYLGGGAGHDLLRGGAGGDTLNGGFGSDTLVGGDGADVFVFNVFDSPETDTVLDFELGSDVLTFVGFDGGFEDLTFQKFDTYGPLFITAGDLTISLDSGAGEPALFAGDMTADLFNFV